LFFCHWIRFTKTHFTGNSSFYDARENIYSTGGPIESLAGPGALFSNNFAEREG
jgi:hypothetical protein